MLRGLVLLFLLLNVALFFWIRSDPHWGQSDREPQRLQHQVAPDAIQVLPDLPSGAPSAVRPGADGASSPEGAASGASAAVGVANPVEAVAGATPAAGPASAKATAKPGDDSVRPSPDSGLLRKTSLAEPVACVESGPLDATQWTALGRALAQAGVPAGAIGERRQTEPGRWIVYLGRYADKQQWQHKADELERLGLKFERVSAPPELNPGLSLGGFASAEEAGLRLDELGRHGVHTARVVQAAAPGVSRRLQVRFAGDAWRTAVGGQRFSACPVAASASL